jgi:hypothetical protein
MLRVRTWAGLPVLVALAGCGGGGSSNPTNPGTVPPTTTPPSTNLPITRTVIDSRTWELRGFTAVFYNQDKLPSGTLDATMTWQNGDHPMALYLTDNTCPGMVDLLEGRCRVLARPEDPAAKPQRLTYQLTGKSTNVSVWVVNPSRQGDTGTLEVGITTDQPLTPADPDPTTDPGDYKSTLPDGPVAKVFIKVRSIDTGNKKYRDPFQDRDGNWILYDGEFVVFDATQKNSAGQECKWTNNPKWTVDDPGFVFVIKGSSQPFLLRADVTKEEGDIVIHTDIDGVESNVLNVKVKKK